MIIGVIVALAVVIAARTAAQAAGPQSFEGDLEIHHSDDFAHGHATFNYKLKTANGDFTLDFADHHPAVPKTTKVRVQGQKDGGVIHVPPGAKVEAADGSGGSGAPAVAAVTGSKRVAVILVKFSPTQAEPYTPATAAGVAFDNANSVAAYYNEVSYGQLTLSGDVLGWYPITADTTACNFSAWSNAADQAATAAGVNLSTYNYRVYAFPQVSACGWAGLAYLPGTLSYLNGTGGMSLRVMSHELGHNLGTHHASTLTCTENAVRVPISANAANCTASEYGDPFTVMGASSNRHATNFSLGNFGWMAAANTLDVSANGTFALTAAEDPSTTATKAIRIARPSGDYLVLELRKPFGTYFDNFGAADPAVTGVSVRIAPGYNTLSQSKLIDATPGTTSFGDAPLPVGASLRDPVRGVTVSTTSVAAGAAQITVSFDADATPPTTPGNLVGSAPSATEAQLSWTASTDNIAVSTYEVRRNGALIGSTPGLSFSDSGLTGGTSYLYAVRALDSSGNASGDATVTVTTPTADTQPPTAPGNLVGTLLSKPSRVSLAWTASTDNVAVTGYVIFRNGLQVATSTALNYIDRPSRGTWKDK